MIELRPYQAEIIGELRQATIAGRLAPCVVSPTGSGKTVMGSWIIASVQQRGNPAMVVAHRRELIWQWSLALHRANVPHDIIAPNEVKQWIICEHVRLHGANPITTGHPCKVGSIQTVHARLNSLAEYDPHVIIIDEGHHATVGSLYDAINVRWAHRIRIHLTATPERLDGLGLGIGHGGYCDELIEGKSPGWLIQNGFLCPYRLISKPCDLKSAKTIQAQEQMMNRRVITGNAVQEYQAHMSGQAAVAFCCTVKHAQDVAEQFQENGITAFAVSGKTESTERNRIISGLGNGYSKVVCSAELIGEGLDIPNIRGVIKLRPTESFALDRQQSGRGLRLFKGKENCIILDHAGNWIKHGLPDTEVKWSLEGAKKRSMRMVDITAIKTCPECFCIHEPAPMCPLCGHIYTARDRVIKHEVGRLQEIKPDPSLLIREKKARRSEQGRARSFADLVRVQFAQKLKPDHAFHIAISRGLPMSEIAEGYKEIVSEIESKLEYADGDGVRLELTKRLSDVKRALKWRLKGLV